MEFATGVILNTSCIRVYYARKIFWFRNFLHEVFAKNTWLNKGPIVRNLNQH